MTTDITTDDRRVSDTVHGLVVCPRAECHDWPCFHTLAHPLRAGCRHSEDGYCPDCAPIPFEAHNNSLSGPATASGVGYAGGVGWNQLLLEIDGIPKRPRSPLWLRRIIAERIMRGARC